MIADEIIDEIRSRADIVAVIGQHVQLKKAGRNWKGLCPFHGEKTPSFNVHPEGRGGKAGGFFYCFGCQKKGDVFNFVMEMEGKSFVEAAEQLGARFGVEVPKIDESPELRRARGEKLAMLDINKHATAFFREVLADPKRGEPGRAYLLKRGVGPEVTEKFQLGYAPPDWHALADYLKAKRVDMELATKLGLVARQPKAGGYYDRYRDRLVCPVIRPGGEIVGFSARVIGKPPAAPDGSEPPKYINSPESLIYKKSQLLFGLAQAREGMQKNGRAVLVEGNFDVISLHQADFTDVIAPLGTALTTEQVLTLKRLADRIVLLYDGDKAGYKATMHALQLCVEADVEVLVARRPGNAKSGGAGVLSDGIDPDSLVASGGAEQLKEAIERAVGGIEFFCFEVWGKARANADARSRALEDAARLIGKIENPTKRDLVIDTFAKALEIDAGVVRAAVVRAGGSVATPPPPRVPGSERAFGDRPRFERGDRGGRFGDASRGPDRGRFESRRGGEPRRFDRDNRGSRGGDYGTSRGDDRMPPPDDRFAPPPDDRFAPPPGDLAYDMGDPGAEPSASHPNAPANAPGGQVPQRGEVAANREKTPVRALDPEVEVISLLTDHPSLLASPDADRVSSLLTEPRLQAMYSAARAGQSFLELASMLLPPATAQHVLSGKYAEVKDPSAQLAALVNSLEQRRTMLAQKGLEKSLAAAQRGGADKELVRLQAQLAVAQRKGDRELVEQLTAQISSNRKQAE